MKKQLLPIIAALTLMACGGNVNNNNNVSNNADNTTIAAETPTAKTIYAALSGQKNFYVYKGDQEVFSCARDNEMCDLIGFCVDNGDWYMLIGHGAPNDAITGLPTPYLLKNGKRVAEFPNCDVEALCVDNGEFYVAACRENGQGKSFIMKGDKKVVEFPFADCGEDYETIVQICVVGGDVYAETSAPGEDLDQFTNIYKNGQRISQCDNSVDECMSLSQYLKIDDANAFDFEISSAGENIVISPSDDAEIVLPKKEQEYNDYQAVVIRK